MNDTLGHPVGDQLLQQVAGRLTQIVGDKGQVRRLGGDEFQIVVPPMSQPEKPAQGIANAIIPQPRQTPFDRRRAGACRIVDRDCGIRRAGVNASALVRKADLCALCCEGTQGAGVYRFYADAMHNQASERKAIEDALRDALVKDELKLLYQPIVDVRSERITGFEALILLAACATAGLISPSKFIPIAEESNLIVPIVRVDHSVPPVRRSRISVRGYRGRGQCLAAAVREREIARDDPERGVGSGYPPRAARTRNHRGSLSRRKPRGISRCSRN